MFSVYFFFFERRNVASSLTTSCRRVHERYSSPLYDSTGRTLQGHAFDPLPSCFANAATRARVRLSSVPLTFLPTSAVRRHREVSTSAITARDIHYLAIDNQRDVPYDIFMILAQHRISKTRIVLRHAFVNVRPMRDNFGKKWSIHDDNAFNPKVQANSTRMTVYVREVFRSQPEHPERWPLLEELAGINLFCVT